MAYDTMHAYYREQAVLPTYGRFQSDADLQAHARHRRDVFTDKLFLPPRLFREARLIEFGPDAGENSLVFARWGANCTLVEPNPKAHQIITDYFARFGLTDRLSRLDTSDLAEFARRPATADKFDIIDAEGFIYTVKPDSLWINLFSRILNDGGFVVLFFCEPFGNFLELFTKAVHARVRDLTGQNAMETALALYLNKWNSIPHKRSLESWVMDVLENPFVRLKYFLEPQALCAQMQAVGLTLYSAWPSYRDGLSVHWFKKALTPAERLRSQNAFIARSRLSHMFGRTHFLRQPDPQMEDVLWKLLTLTDGLIDRFAAAETEHCIEHLDMLAKYLTSSMVLSDECDTTETLLAIRSLQQILRLLAREAVAELIDFCNHDPGFMRTWGGPSHFAVFRKEPAA